MLVMAETKLRFNWISYYIIPMLSFSSRCLLVGDLPFLMGCMGCLSVESAIWALAQDDGCADIHGFDDLGAQQTSFVNWSGEMNNRHYELQATGQGSFGMDHQEPVLLPGLH